MVLRDFVKNFEDMCDDNGYQFKFFCDICQDGYVTNYSQAPFAKMRSMLGAASNLASGLGGLGSRLGGFGGMSGVGSGAKGAADSLHNTKWREAKEKAFDEAVAEAKGHFTKCQGCAKYVDATCWNEQSQMCIGCVPRSTVTVQKARAQAFAAKTQAAMNTEDFSAEIKDAEEAKIMCSNCGKPTTSGKFCESCGTSLQKTICSNCGAKLTTNATFCSNCGQKVPQTKS